MHDDRRTAGLASMGKSMRECEKLCGAPGKTPDHMPTPGRPFSGYIRSSLELFRALKESGFSVSPDSFVHGIFEVYPGNIWYCLTSKILPNGIPDKHTQKGRRARKIILGALGVAALPDLPTHDENDACIGALLAAAADNKVDGVVTVRRGQPLLVESDGTLREGPMIIPEISPEAQGRIERALKEVMPDLW